MNATQCKGKKRIGFKLKASGECNMLGDNEDFFKKYMRVTECIRCSTG